jgi:hypothetical protein
VGQGAAVAPPAPGDTEEQPPREQWLAAVGVISRWQVIYILKKENILLVHKTKERRQKRTGGPNDTSFGPLACTHTPCSPCRLRLRVRPRLRLPLCRCHLGLGLGLVIIVEAT